MSSARVSTLDLPRPPVRGQGHLRRSRPARHAHTTEARHGHLTLLGWLCAGIAQPILTLAYLGAGRRVAGCHKDVESARRHFGPGSLHEDHALDRLESAIERRQRARSRLLRGRTPG